MFKKIILLVLFTFLLSQPVVATGGVEYNLPYPGILPDSPVYVLKVMRENIFSFFIRDPKQKAFYQLFLSDKRLAAGLALVGKKNYDLGATTILKSQEYFTQAVDLAARLKDPDLTAKLIVSGSKHEELISDLATSEKIQKALAADQKDKNRVLELSTPQ